MDVKLLGGSVSTLAVADTIFAREYNEALVHQLVVAYQANARSASSAQKGRSDVAKSTRKPWRQKGTGRARAGMASSPLWRGGGKIFPNGPEENYSHKVNRKMYRAGICSILSQLVREDRLLVVDDLSIDQPKTKLLSAKLKSMGLTSVLLIADEIGENLFLAARNLKNVMLLQPHQADPVSLVRYQKVVMTKAAVLKIEELLG